MELIIRLIIMLVKSLSGDDKPQPGRSTPPPPPRRVQPLPSQSGGQVQQSVEDERLRKFMEALGVPPGTPPPRNISRSQPPPVANRPPPRPQLPAKKPVARQVVPPIPAAARVESSYQTESVGSTQTAKSDYEIPVAVPAVASLSPATGSPALAAAPAVDFRSLLRSPSSIRTAMVLKEILGPPRGLQPMDAPPGLR